MARFEVKVLPWAVTDVNNQYVYFIEQGDLRAAEDFEKRVRQGLKELEETALQYQIISEPMRRCPLEQFQHGITYEVEGDLVIVPPAAELSPNPLRVNETELMLDCIPMSNYARILSEALELLTEEERRKLSLELVPDESDVDPAIDEMWQAEVHRRRLRRKNGETQAQPWEDVEAELMSL
jgi:hypothetical protein